jgi:hypothetical protein
MLFIEGPSPLEIKDNDSTIKKSRKIIKRMEKTR